MNFKLHNLILPITSLVLVSLLCGCKEKMSEESLEAAREGLRQREIKQLGEAEIFAAGLEKARMITDSLLDLHTFPPDPELIASVDTTFNVTTLVIPVSEVGTASETEQMLMEAYLYNYEKGLPLQDNIDKASEDSLIYTVPKVTENGDTTYFAGMVAIKMGTRDIVNSINVKRSLFKKED